MADLHDLVAAFAVDALDETERAAFETHLAGCAACTAEVAAMRPGVAALAESVATPPPDHMRAAVLSAIATTDQLEPAAGSQQTQVIDMQERRIARYRRLAVGLGAAAILAAAVAAGSLLTSAGQTRTDAILTAADTATVSLNGDVGSAQLVYSASEAGGLFISSNLPAVGADQTYQLWLIDGAGPTSAGLFTPRDGAVVFLVEDLAPGQTLGMTIEPIGGSPAPTGEVLLAVELN